MCYNVSEQNTASVFIHKSDFAIQNAAADNLTFPLFLLAAAKYHQVSR